MSFAERLAVKIGSYLVPQRAAYRMARAVFATQGIGWAGPANGLNGSGEARFLRNYLSGIEHPVVFDVGANVGNYALAALAGNAQAIVHCFEPSASHFQRLQRAVTGPGMRVNNVGLSEKAEELLLHKDTDVTGLASLS